VLGGGVPAYHLNPGAMYFIQTPKEVLLFLAGRTRRIYLNVPHSAKPKPSWYGESVGHYEVAIPAGRHDRIQRPHLRRQLSHAPYHRAACDGALQTGRWRDAARCLLHVEDRNAFNAPWSATRSRQRVSRGPRTAMSLRRGPQQLFQPRHRAGADGGKARFLSLNRAIPPLPLEAGVVGKIPQAFRGKTALVLAT